MRYWDTSALIPLIAEESESSRLRSLLVEDPSRVSWWGTPIECYSSLTRLKRQGGLSDSDFHVARERCDRMMQEIDFVVPSHPLRDRALRLLMAHPLRAGDAIQLAAALRWSQDQTRGVAFVTLDDRLRCAAQVEGFSVLP